MKLEKITKTMLIVVLGLVSAYGDLSFVVEKKLEELQKTSWDQLRNSLCNISHNNRPISAESIGDQNFPVYYDGFRWAEIRLLERDYRRSIRISNKSIPFGETKHILLKKCSDQTDVNIRKEFYNIPYPEVYFGYFSQNKIIENMSEDQQNKEKRYEELYREYDTAQSELDKLEPDVLNNRYKIDKKRTNQLRLYFKDYIEDDEEQLSGRILALYIDNPSTEDLGLAMSVCKIAHSCIELTKNSYNELKNINYEQAEKDIEEEVEVQSKAIYKKSKKQVLMKIRLSRIFMNDFLTYKGKTDLLDTAIGGLFGAFSEKADSAIRNRYNDLYDAQNPIVLDSNHLMLATIVGVGSQNQLTEDEIRCNVYAFQEGFYRYLFRQIEKIINLKDGKDNQPEIILKLIQLIDNRFLKGNGFSERITPISHRIKGVASKLTSKCDALLSLRDNQSYRFLEKRIKFKRHRLAKKFGGAVIDAFKAIKDFFVGITGLVVGGTNAIVNLVSTVIYGVLYSAFHYNIAISNFVHSVAYSTTKSYFVSGAFMIPHYLISKIIKPIGEFAHKIKTATNDPNFLKLLDNIIYKIWKRNDEYFLLRDKGRFPIQISTYIKFSEKPKMLNKIFSMLLGVDYLD